MEMGEKCYLASLPKNTFISGQKGKALNIFCFYAKKNENRKKILGTHTHGSFYYASVLPILNGIEFLSSFSLEIFDFDKYKCFGVYFFLYLHFLHVSSQS